jgi:hypothetical protein
MYRVLAQPLERHMLQQRVEYFSLERSVAAYEKLILGFV